MSGTVRFNRDGKFDLQLSQALIRERKLGEMFEGCNLARIELKSESWMWEKSGNLCVEFEWNGKPSGIASTQATCWIHELLRDGEMVCQFVFPVANLRRLVREAIAAGHYRDFAGDDGLSSVALLNIRDLLR